MRLVIFFTVLIGSILFGFSGVTSEEEKDVVIGDNNTSNKKTSVDLDVEFTEEQQFLRRCSWDIERYIRESDFCIMGKTIINKHEPVSKSWEDRHTSPWITEGEIEIESIFYGNPKAKRIPFLVTDALFKDPWGIPPPFIPQSGGVRKNSIVIIMGKGIGENITILHVIQIPVISGENIKLIKKLEELNKKEFSKQREKLLSESNNVELLSYLFRRSLRETKMEETILMLGTLSTKDKITQERKFLAYGFAFYIIHYKYSEINDTHRKLLIDIITKRFSEIRTLKEGIKYLRLIDRFTPFASDPFRETSWMKDYFPPTLFKRTPIIKDKIKEIVEKLSRQFEKEDDYAKWEKWVKETFLNDIPEEK